MLIFIIIVITWGSIIIGEVLSIITNTLECQDLDLYFNKFQKDLFVKKFFIIFQ